MDLNVDLGYFGPGSVTWRLHGEPLTIVGGVRALLLQGLHPGAMAKMVEVSDFRCDPWGRLRRTARYVHVISFGSRAQADRAAAHVRALHHLLGIDDAEQMGWVHAALVDSVLAASRLAGVQLNTADMDGYVREQVLAARLIGVPEERIVHNLYELRDLIDEMRPRLRAGRNTRAAALVLAFPPLPVSRRHAPLARAQWTTVVALGVGSLPRWARRMYLLPPLPGGALTTAITLRTLRSSIHLLSGTAWGRTAPARHHPGRRSDAHDQYGGDPDVRAQYGGDPNAHDQYEGRSDARHQRREH